jgi:hypothetical protein
LPTISAISANSIPGATPYRLVTLSGNSWVKKLERDSNADHGRLSTGRRPVSLAGWMFWLTWNVLSGS